MITPKVSCSGVCLYRLLRIDLRRLALLDVHDHAHALAVALVAHVLDAVDPLLARELGDLLDQARLVDLVGDLGDDDRLAVALARLDLGARAHHDRAAAGAVGRADALAAHDEAGGREVRAGMRAITPSSRSSGVRSWFSSRKVSASTTSPEVVRRDVRGHADRDPGGAVHEQVRQHGRQHRRLDRAVVVGGLVVDGLLLDVLHHRGAEPGEPRLGVALRRGRVAVHRAEVALPVDERCRAC